MITVVAAEHRHAVYRPIVVEPAGDGELRIRRASLEFTNAIGAFTGADPRAPDTVTV